MPTYTDEDIAKLDAQSNQQPQKVYSDADIAAFDNQNQPDSMATQGLDYISQHPFKTAFEGVVKTVTGKGIEDRMTENIPTDTSKMSIPDMVGTNLKRAAVGTVGEAADMLTSPLSLAIPAAKAIGATGKAISNVGKFLNFDQKALSLGQKVRQVAAAAKQTAVDKFGASIDAQAAANPNTTVSLENVINDIKTNLPDMPLEAQGVFRKVPLLKNMLKEPGTEGYIDSSNISLKDTQEIINYINTKIPRSIKSTSLDVLDAQNDIRAAQLDAFPEMTQTRAEYGKFAEDYKLIKSALNPKATPGAIMSNFNNNIAVKDAANRVLSPVIEEMKGLRQQAATVGWLKKLGLGAMGVEAAYEIGKKVAGR